MGRWLDSLQKDAEKLAEGVQKSDLADRVRDTVEEVGSPENVEKVRNKLQRAKQVGYEVAGTFERAVEDKRGIGGVIASVGENVDMLYGILKTVGRPLVSPAIDRAKVHLEPHWKRLTQYHDEFVRTFSTEGEYDEDKVGDFLMHKAYLAEVFGIEACNTVADLLNRGATAVEADYRQLIPSRADLQTKYDGIGTKYNGLLLVPNLEACLAFHERAFGDLPRTQMALAVLDDIKPSASTSWEGLVAFYEHQAASSYGEKINFVREIMNKGGE